MGMKYYIFILLQGFSDVFSQIFYSFTEILNTFLKFPPNFFQALSNFLKLIKFRTLAQILHKN